MSRDDLLRAAVYAAFERKAEPDFGLACDRAIVVHRLWPLIEYEHAIDDAAELEWYEQTRSRLVWREDLPQLAAAIIRESYPLPLEVAA